MVKDDNNMAKVALLLRTSPTEYMYIVDVLPREVLSWCHKNVKDNRCCIRAVRDMLMLAEPLEQPGRVV